MKKYNTYNVYQKNFGSLIIFYREDSLFEFLNPAPFIVLDKVIYKGSTLLLKDKYRRWPGEIGINKIALILIEDFKIAE